MARAARRDPPDGLLERLELLGGDDEAVAAFLDSLEVGSPRERELLADLARTAPVRDLDATLVAHRRLVGALEALGRHGYHSASVGRRLGPLRAPVRFLVQLVARYLVVSYLRRVATDLRNLYGLRAVQAPIDWQPAVVLGRLRDDAESLIVIFNRRQVGVPSFLFGGLLVSLFATVGRVATGAATSDWRAATAVGVVGFLIALGISWIALRGAALASRRIRLSVREPLGTLWNAVGSCGRPPRDQSRQLAIVAIVLTFGAWVLVPVAVGLALAG